MTKVDKLLIFLASPGDVPKERRYVQEVIDELNRTVAASQNIILQVVSWQKDAYPGYGKDAQALINQQIAKMSTYSLFVGIMWNRLGTPTPRADSGTVEEFELAVTALAQYGQPEIWFYFSKAKSSLDTEEACEQRKKVLSFKKQVETNGMPWNYNNPSDFKNKFRNQISMWLTKTIRTKLDDNKSVSGKAPENIVDKGRSMNIIKALLNASKQKAEDEKKIYGEIKSELVAEIARLEFELERLKEFS